MFSFDIYSVSDTKRATNGGVGCACKHVSRHFKDHVWPADLSDTIPRVTIYKGEFDNIISHLETAYEDFKNTDRPSEGSTQLNESLNTIVANKLKEARLYANCESELMKTADDSDRHWSFNVFGPFVKDEITLYPVSGTTETNDNMRYCRSYMLLNDTQDYHPEYTKRLAGIVTSLIKLGDSKRRGEPKMDLQLVKLTQPELEDQILSQSVHLYNLTITNGDQHAKKAASPSFDINERLSGIAPYGCTRLYGDRLNQLKREILVANMILLGGQVSTDGVFVHGMAYTDERQPIAKKYPVLLGLCKMNSPGEITENRQDEWYRANVALFFLVLSSKLNQSGYACTSCEKKRDATTYLRSNWYSTYLLFNIFTVCAGQAPLQMPSNNAQATYDWFSNVLCSNISRLFVDHQLPSPGSCPDKVEALSKLTAVATAGGGLQQKFLDDLINDVLKTREVFNKDMFSLLIEMDLVLPSANHRLDDDDRDVIHHSYVACSNSDPGNTFHCCSV